MKPVGCLILNEQVSFGQGHYKNGYSGKYFDLE